MQKEKSTVSCCPAVMGRDLLGGEPVPRGRCRGVRKRREVRCSGMALLSPQPLARVQQAGCSCAGWVLKISVPSASQEAGSVPDPACTLWVCLTPYRPALPSHPPQVTIARRSPRVGLQRPYPCTLPAVLHRKTLTQGLLDRREI